MSESEPAHENSSPDPTGAAVASSEPRSGHSRLRAIAFMIIGLATGAACAMFLPEFWTTFQMPPEFAALLENPERLKPEQQEELNKQGLLVSQKNSALTFAIFGAALGGVFGIVSILTRKPRLFLVGLILGVIAGGAGGAASGYAAATTFDYAMNRSIEFSGALVHLVAFSIIGIGLGLCFTLTSGSLRTLPGYLAAGALAGLLGALVFHPFIAWYAPTENLELILPVDPVGQSVRMLWGAIPAALFGLFLGGRAVATTRGADGSAGP